MGPRGGHPLFGAPVYCVYSILAMDHGPRYRLTPCIVWRGRGVFARQPVAADRSADRLDAGDLWHRHGAPSCTHIVVGGRWWARSFLHQSQTLPRSRSSIALWAATTNACLTVASTRGLGLTIRAHPRRGVQSSYLHATRRGPAPVPRLEAVESPDSWRGPRRSSGQITCSDSARRRPTFFSTLSFPFSCSPHHSSASLETVSRRSRAS